MLGFAATVKILQVLPLRSQKFSNLYARLIVVTFCQCNMLYLFFPRNLIK